MKKSRRHFVTLLLLVLLFAAPGVTAYLLYFYPQWFNLTKTNKGQLLNPPVLLTELGNNAKWQLVLWSPGACEKSCITQLDKLTRIRLALGRRLYAVDLTLLMGSSADPMPTDVVNRLHNDGVSLISLSADESIILSSRYKQPELFIANPDHYLVLAYSPGAPPDDLYHDIKLLLAKGN